MNDENLDKYIINAGNNDFIYHVFDYFFKSRPIVIGFVFFIISFVINIFIGYITGHLNNPDFSPMMKNDYMNLINAGLVIPVGAAILFNLYNKINTIFFILKQNNIIMESDNKFKELINKTQNLLTNKKIVWFAFLLSLITGIYIIMFSKEEAWNGIHGGITSYYFRIFSIVVGYITILIIYKCIIAVRTMRKLFSMKLKMQPLHPDKCGGLKPLGDLSVAINYFLGLILTDFIILAIFDQAAQASIIFVLTFISLFIFSILLLYFSLSKAHKQMDINKRTLLLKLHHEFQENYEKFINFLNKGDYRKHLADKIQSINHTFQITEKMPVWPFDIKSLSRFFTTISIPLIIFIIQLITNADSIIYHLDELKIFKLLFGK